MKHRRTITKPVVQTIFNEPTPPPAKKSNLKKPNNTNNVQIKDNVEDNRVSTLIHMTSSDHDENNTAIKTENEYIEVVARPHLYQKTNAVDDDEEDLYDERHEVETLSLKSRDDDGNQTTSAAESLFFADVSPVVKNRPRNFRSITDYGDRLSQSSQTSA